MKYRKEIDGLRALAVVPVILFHAGFSSFRGGFVGVDIFFVISGYLITSIIAKELDNDSFSIQNFYERRARRILPALFFVMIISFFAGYFILVPPIFLSFSKSLISVSLFVSNFELLTTNYFGLKAEVKPLLHTWSLAVEEQFYIFFPIFLAFIWKFRKRNVFQLIFLLSLVSLTVDHISLKNGFKTFAFYMLPSRGFELLLGALIALYFNFRKEDNSKGLFLSFILKRSVSEILSLLGLILIVFSMFLFDKDTPFPSFFALIPIGGTGLVIAFSDEKSFVGRVLGNRFLVKIGLVSYSAYLWHQPLLVFSRILGRGEPNLKIKLLVILLVFCLAYLTWLLVESPFRKKDLVTRKQIFLFSAIGLVLFPLLGVLGIKTDGMVFRYSSEQVSFWKNYENYKYLNDLEKIMRYRCSVSSDSSLVSAENISTNPMPEECYVRDLTKSKSVFLWGDSHAQMLYSGLNASLPNEFQIMQVAAGACKPNSRLRTKNLNPCDQNNLFALKKISENKPDVVIVAQLEGHDLSIMKNKAKVLKEIGVKKIIFTGPSPVWEPIYLPSLVAFTFMPKSIPRVSNYGLNREYFKDEDYLKSNFFKIENVFYASIRSSLCSEDGCLVYLGNNPANGLTVWDNSHLTPIASEKVAKEVLLPLILKNN